VVCPDGSSWSTALRRIALQTTDLADATCGTIVRKLFNISALRWPLAEELTAPDNMWVTGAMLDFSNRTSHQIAALLGANWVRSAEGWPPK
jgi:hypothetical protein